MNNNATDRDAGGLRVIVADHQPLTRGLLVALLESTPGVSVVAEVSDATAALGAAAQDPPDAMLLRTDLPGFSAIATARAARQSGLRTGIALLFPTLLDAQLDEAIQGGAHGLLSYDDPASELIAGLRALGAGEPFRSASVRARLVPRGAGASSPEGDRGAPSSPLSTLTPREREILAYIATGLTQKEIAEIVGLAPKTVDNHSGRLMSKLGIHNRVLLTRFAIREGIVGVES
ncbi:MAG: LuxR C-terminal-related transcriptional regulator [Phycisphaerales bacterium]